MTFNDIDFKACPRCGIEPGVEVMRSITEPKVMRVACPACGMSNSVVFGDMGQASFDHAVAMLADSWNCR